jgi:hypothetical protein
LRNTKKICIIVIVIFITLAISGGVTVAYLTGKTPEVENKFKPVYVDCSVVEDVNGTTTSNVRVENTGDISAYIRATYVAMWIADDGSVWGVAPKEGVDYTLNLGSAIWQLGSDGFFYYAYPVASGELTEALIDSINVLGEAPEGHTLVIHVAATAVQSEPSTAVEDLWGANVSDNGMLIAP